MASCVARLIVGCLASSDRAVNCIREGFQFGVHDRGHSGHGLLRSRAKGSPWSCRAWLWPSSIAWRGDGSFGALRRSPRSCVRPASVRPASIGRSAPKAVNCEFEPRVPLRRPKPTPCPTKWMSLARVVHPVSGTFLRCQNPIR